MLSKASIHIILINAFFIGGIVQVQATPKYPDYKYDASSREAKIDEIIREWGELKKAKAEQEASRAKILTTGEPNVKVTLSGWINRAAAFYDNGYNSELKHVDANAQSSRTTLAGEGIFNENYKAGFTLQLEYVSESSKFVDIGNSDGSSKYGAQAFSINKRIIEAYMDTKWGRLALGQGEMATNKLMSLDLSGTNVVADGGELESQAGGVRFATGKGGYTQSDGATTANVKFLRVQDVYNEILGVKRFNRIRYDTPKWRGFGLSVAHGVRDRFDTALKYAGEINKIKLVAGIGWFHDPFPESNTFASTQNSAKPFLKSLDQYGGSFSLLLPVGISAGAGLAWQRFKEKAGFEGRQNGRTWNVKLGYQQTWFNLGKTAFAVTYGESLRAMANAPAVGATSASQRYGGDNSAKAKILGAYLVQNIDRWGSEVYLAWQTHKLNIRNGLRTEIPTGTTNYNVTVNTLGNAGPTSNMPFKSINSVLVGTRIKF